MSMFISLFSKPRCVQLCKCDSMGRWMELKIIHNSWLKKTIFLPTFAFCYVSGTNVTSQVNLINFLLISVTILYKNLGYPKWTLIFFWNFTIKNKTETKRYDSISAKPITKRTEQSALDKAPGHPQVKKTWLVLYKLSEARPKPTAVMPNELLVKIK